MSIVYLLITRVMCSLNKSTVNKQAGQSSSPRKIDWAGQLQAWLGQNHVTPATHGLPIWCDTHSEDRNNQLNWKSLFVAQDVLRRGGRRGGGTRRRGKIGCVIHKLERRRWRWLWRMIERERGGSNYRPLSLSIPAITPIIGGQTPP